MEEYKIINRGRKGNDYHVISVHYSHIDAVNSFDQLRGREERATPCKLSCCRDLLY